MNKKENKKHKKRYKLHRGRKIMTYLSASNPKEQKGTERQRKEDHERILLKRNQEESLDDDYWKKR